MLKNKINK